MTDTPKPAAPPQALNERLIFGLRQGGLLAIALLVAGLVTERLRPDDALDRGIASTPFLWAIVLWLIVLLVNAIAFDTSQTRALEGTPLYAAVGAAAVVFLVGLVSLDAGSFGRRFVYLFANSLGALMFWWAAISLAYLATRRITD